MTLTKFLEKTDSIKSFEPFIKAMADKNRLSIIEMLLTRKMCVSDIAAAINLAFTTTSYHLEVLYSVGILLSHNIGKKVFYNVNQDFIDTRLTLLRDSIHINGGLKPDEKVE